MFRTRTVAVAAIAALALVGAAAQPADAGPLTPNRGRYAALGDSYAAGVGNPSLKNSGTAGRSAAAYPVLLADGVNKVTFLAVSGATTARVATDQVPQIPRGVEQVTLTVGGNDVGFSQVVGACTTSTFQACALAVNDASARIPGMMAGLADLIDEIEEQAPRAEIYVTGYPILFQAPGVYCGPEIAVVDAANAQLNAAIETVATSSGATYVDVASEFEGHGICSADSWILRAGSPAPLHPTAAGQQAYADAVEATDFTSAAES